MAIEKVIFGSNAWVAEAGSILQRLLAESHQKCFSIRVCEVFRNVPDDLPGAHSDGTRAWHFEIAGAASRVSDGQINDPDIFVSADYHGVLELARTVYLDEPAEVARVAAIRERLVNAGQFYVSTTSIEPPLALRNLLNRLHNELAIRTA